MGFPQKLELPDPPPQKTAPANVGVALRTTIYLAASIAAFSGVAYELLLATYATYLLGASIFQYSLIISVMMASMGVGALFTHNRKTAVLSAFVEVELVLSAAAVTAIPALYFCYAKGIAPYPIILAYVFIIGAAIGSEIPLLNQLDSSESSVSRILFFDYVGGFIGGLIFPLWLVPQFGLFRTGASLAALNAVVAGITLVAGRKHFEQRLIVLVIATSVMIAATCIVGVQAEAIRLYMESKFFQITP